MPPIETSLILEALVSGIRKIATKEVEEAYSKLKSLLLKKLAASQSGQDALNQLEDNPDDSGVQESLTKELEIVDANKDTAVVQTAQKLRAITTQISVNNRHSSGIVITTGRDYVDRRISISLWQLSLLLILAGFLGFGGAEIYELPGKLFPLKRKSLPQPVSNPSTTASVNQPSSTAKPVARSSPTVTPKRLSPAPVVQPIPTADPERLSSTVASKRENPARVDRSRRVLPPVASSKLKSTGIPSTQKINNSSLVIKRSVTLSNECRSGLDPFQLVRSCAYAGLLRSYGIPGYGALESDYQAQTIDAEAIVQAGIKARLLSPNTLQNRHYMNAVELHMKNLH